MKILLCGAGDIERVLDRSNDTITVMGHECSNYLYQNIGANNIDGNAINSMNAVKNSELVVFVFIQNRGEITWEVEYITAVNLGIPFVILCEEELYHHIFKTLREPGTIINEDHKFYNIQGKILTLIETEKNIVRFSIDKSRQFENALKLQIQFQVSEAMALLKERNKNAPLLRLLKGKAYHDDLKLELNDIQKSQLIDILFNPFENKELRKRALHYFTLHKGLSDNQIEELICDSEQGISRAAVNLVPKLISDKNKKEDIVAAIVDATKNNDDTGLLRRAIHTIFEIDIPIAVKGACDFFPAYDIGTPRRILHWLDDNYANIAPLISNTEFHKTLITLIDLCEDYTNSQKKEGLSDLANEVREKIQQTLAP